MKFFNHTVKSLLALIVMLVSLFGLISPAASAAEESRVLDGVCYEKRYEVDSARYNDDFRYDASESSAVKVFTYGKKALGEMTITGSVIQQSTVNGYPAFSANDPMIIRYVYDDTLYNDEKTSWTPYPDSYRFVAGVTLKKSNDFGIIAIQKSYDGITWEDATEPRGDYFLKSRMNEKANLYEITASDLLAGTYFRVVVAYDMRMQTAKKQYSHLCCTEVYQFYVCLNKSPLMVWDLTSGKVIDSGTTVKSGFTVNKMGSVDTVLLQKDNGKPVEVTGVTLVQDPGRYTFKVTTPIGQTFNYYYTVTDGLKTASLTPKVYENVKKDKYTLENPVNGNTSFGVPSYTRLTLGQTSAFSFSVKQGAKNGYTGYGTTGDSVFVLLQLQNSDRLSANGWEIVSDDWGDRKSEKIDGLHTGKVGTGALVIQTSTDGKTWNNEDLSRYANGLYTTDYENHYGDKGDVLVYVPDGNAVIRGVFIRVLYAYEVAQSGTKNDSRCIEEYIFYLCSDNLDAVTFHNLSVAGQVEEKSAEYDNATAEVIRRAETMKSGSYTVSGFRIDNSLNPTVQYTVKRNGAQIKVPSNREFAESGKYDISLTSAVGSKRQVTLYVDRMSAEEALRYYFGNAFIKDKRIFAEDEYPVFEGGYTSWQLAAVDLNHLPLAGKITNLTTGEENSISAARTAKSGALKSPGSYEAVLSTNPDFGAEGSSGDCRSFTFRFSVIAEGTAPGPQVNQKNLSEYAATTVTDCNPRYYGLTFSSASKGNITLAFSTKEAALNYARNYEQGTVEVQRDGSYRYTGSFVVRQKDKYESNWDLLDAIDFFANQAVQELYFDLSDEFSVITLPEEVIKETENIRTLELNNSVVLFADGEKTKLAALSSLPILSPKPHYYLSPGRDGKVTAGYDDFEFVRDAYRCDSDSVVIKDANGKEYPIEYNRGVGSQLAAKGCPSGVVTITEKTVYGDTATYQSVFIASGDITTQVVLGIYDGAEESQKTYSKDNSGDVLTVSAFTLSAIKDDLDPYALVIVSHDGLQNCFVADKLPKTIYADPGQYIIKAVNRIGSSFTCTVNVEESDMATISFTGDGAEDVDFITTSVGQQHVRLPELSRYGYTHIGFEDDAGVLYQDEIASVRYNGSTVLTAVWEPKQYTLTLLAPDQSVIGEEKVKFGRTTELPVPDLGSGYDFSGWSLDGTILESNTFTLDTESDVTLVATAVASSSDAGSTSDNNEAAEHHGSAWIWIAVPVALLIIVGGVLFRKKKEINRKN